MLLVNRCLLVHALHKWWCIYRRFLFYTCCIAGTLQTCSLQLLCEWTEAISGQNVFKEYPHSPCHLNSAYSWQVWKEEGDSNCVNSSGNCVWPLTVSVIASLLQYFAWQSERLTPKGWRPGALRLTGRGLLKSPTCSPPYPSSSKPPLILFRVRGRVGGLSVQPSLRLCRLKPEGPLAHADVPSQAVFLHLDKQHCFQLPFFNSLLVSFCLGWSCRPEAASYFVYFLGWFCPCHICACIFTFPWISYGIVNVNSR